MATGTHCLFQSHDLSSYGKLNPAAANMPDHSPFPIIEAALGVLLFHL